MNQQSGIQAFWTRIAVWMRRLSIKRKITFIILLAFLFTLPPIALSVQYVSRILQEIDQIIETDVALGRNSSDLLVLMFDIRRNERTYHLLGSAAERDSITVQVRQAWERLSASAILAGTAERPLIRRMENSLRAYERNFDLLVRYMEEHPPQLSSRTPDVLGLEVERYRAQYQLALMNLERANPAERDSLVSSVYDQLEALTANILAGAEITGNGAGEIQNALDLSAQEFQAASEELAGEAWENLQEHRTEGFYLEARAKRNIILVMIVTTFLYLYMLTSMPRKIMRPVTRLNALLRRGMAGNFSEHAREYSNDEIGDLASNYNQVLDRFQYYEELKTRKIGSQKRMIDRMLEMLPSPVAMMNVNLALQYYNAPFADLLEGKLPPRAPDTGFDLARAEGSERLVEELRAALNSTKTEFFIELSSRDGVTHRLKGRIIRNPLMEQESVLLIEVPKS